MKNRTTAPLPRLLIVDDEAPLADALAMLFQSERIDAVAVSTREAAEELMSREFFAVILADVRLCSEEDGLHLLRSIRAIAPASRVASLTGYASPSLEARLQDLGAELVLYKPIEFDELLRVVRELLGASSTEDASVDELDLDELYSRVKKLLYALPGRRYGLTSDEAEEIVQQAWCLFLEKQPTIRQPRSWLAGAVVNLCRQTISEKSRNRDREYELTADLQDGASNEHDDGMIVHQALARVDERTRTLCTLIALENRSYEDVSRLIGIPLGSIGPLYMRAKLKLKSAILSG